MDSIKFRKMLIKSNWKDRKDEAIRYYIKQKIRQIKELREQIKEN